MIDFRSDTVTKPSKEMLKSMSNAEIGDDVFNEDPSINKLQTLTAEMFGMEASLFCPSGTMTNQIALKVHTNPGEEILCHPFSHIYNYEGGGIAANSSCQVRLSEGDRGLTNSENLRKLINPDDVHAARTSLISLENTSNLGGGSCYESQEIERIKALSIEKNVGLHLDGARLFNALVAKKQSAEFYGQNFDSISICLSKGLGCPVGSLLLGNSDFIREAKRIRKRFGGGMRQAGYLAAAGIYALENNIDRLEEDHQKAQEIKTALENLDWVDSIQAVETNIIIFQLIESSKTDSFVNLMKSKGVLLIKMGSNKIRIVTHLDVSAAQTKEFTDLLASIKDTDF